MRQYFYKELENSSSDQNSRLCWGWHLGFHMLEHTAGSSSCLGVPTCPCFPFQGSFCYSWQSPLSPSWWVNTFNSNMFSFSSMRDRVFSAFPQTCTWRLRRMLHLNRHSQTPAARALCNALNKWFLLKCLAPTKSIAPIILSEWICNSLTDGLTYHQPIRA